MSETSHAVRHVGLGSNSFDRLSLNPNSRATLPMTCINPMLMDCITVSVSTVIPNFEANSGENRDISSEVQNVKLRVANAIQL